MRIVLLVVASKVEPWLQELASQYQKKINHLHKFELITLKPKKYSRDHRDIKKTEDSKLLLEKIESTDGVILCDEKGHHSDTLELEKKISAWFAQSSRKRLVFIIGGAYGVSDELRKRADWILSLSKLTFNHHLAQAVLLEQIYRILTVRAKLPYHNE